MTIEELIKQHNEKIQTQSTYINYGKSEKQPLKGQTICGGLYTGI